jgi:hypothetical protein
MRPHARTGRQPGTASRRRGTIRCGRAQAAGAASGGARPASAAAIRRPPRGRASSVGCAGKRPGVHADPRPPRRARRRCSATIRRSPGRRPASSTTASSNAGSRYRAPSTTMWVTATTPDHTADHPARGPVSLSRHHSDRARRYVHRMSWQWPAGAACGFLIAAVGTVYRLSNGQLIYVQKPR